LDVALPLESGGIELTGSVLDVALPLENGGIEFLGPALDFVALSLENGGIELTGSVLDVALPLESGGIELAKSLDVSLSSILSSPGGFENTVNSLTEDEIRAAKKKAKKAKKNLDLAARRREKRRVEKFQKSLLSELPTANPGEGIDVISTIEDFLSVPSSVPALPEIVADSDTVSSIPDDYGESIPATCIEPDDMDVPNGQVMPSATESREVHSRLSPSEIAQESSSYYSHQMNEHNLEYVHLYDLPYSATGEQIVSFFESLVGPVYSLSMVLDENRLYTGEALLLFRNAGDASRAMFFFRYGCTIQGRRIKMKLKFAANGLQLHPCDLASDGKPIYYLQL
jgi:hypothetical protein